MSAAEIRPETASEHARFWVRSAGRRTRGALHLPATEATVEDPAPRCGHNATYPWEGVPTEVYPCSHVREKVCRSCLVIANGGADPRVTVERRSQSEILGGVE